MLENKYDMCLLNIMHKGVLIVIVLSIRRMFVLCGNAEVALK